MYVCMYVYVRAGALEVPTVVLDKSSLSLLVKNVRMRLLMDPISHDIPGSALPLAVTSVGGRVHEQRALGVWSMHGSQHLPFISALFAREHFSEELQSPSSERRLLT